MKKTIGILFLMLMFPMLAHAGFTVDTPQHMYGAQYIEFGVTSPPSDTCSSWGRHFRFDATTPAGKNILSILLSAIMSNRKVSIWYAPSSTPGTNENTGCKLATVNLIGLE